MSRWYRAYEGTVTDSKLGEVALIASTSRSVVIATWHAILENCASLNRGGQFDIPARRVAAALAEPLATIEQVFAGLEEVGMTAERIVCAWSKRQFESDSSTERSRKRRGTQCNADATLHERCATALQPHATPPETETETEKKGSEANASDAVASPEPEPARDIRGALFGKGLQSLAIMTGKTPDSCRALVGRWLKSVNDEAIHVLGAIEDAERNRIADPVAWINRVLANYAQTSNGGRNGSARSGSVLAAFDRLEQQLSGGDDHPPGQTAVRRLSAR